MASPNWDFTNGTWNSVERWAQAELSRLREANDRNTLSPEATSALRGEIAFAKRLIGLPVFIAEEEARASAEPAVDY